MWITVVVTVTKAHVNADDKPHAPDNLIYFHVTRPESKRNYTEMQRARKKERREEENGAMT